MAQSAVERSVGAAPALADAHGGPAAAGFSGRRRRGAAELKALSVLAAPIILTQLSHMGMSAVDAVMAGRVSPVDLAGVALGASFFWPGLLLLSGIVMSVTPTVSQMHGAGQASEAGAVVRQALWIALIGGLLLAVPMQFGEVGYRLVGVDPLAIPVASGYISAMSFGLVPILGYFVFRYLCDGMSWTRPAMVVALSALAVKVPLNYLFVYGGFGVPAMGGVGCGVSGAIVMWGELIAMIAIARYSRVRAVGVLARFSWPDPAIMWRLLKLGVPIGFALFFEMTVFSVVTLLVGNLGVEAVAAHQIASNVGGVTFMIPLALGMAATIRVGYNIGARDYAGARRSVFVALGASLAFACVAAALLLWFRGGIAGLYTTDAEVVAKAAGLLLIVALYQFVDDTQVTAMGALRGYKDTRAPMLTAAFAYWAIGLPVGAALGFGLGGVTALGVTGFWVGLVAGLSVAAVMLIWRVWRLSGNVARVRRLALG